MFRVDLNSDLGESFGNYKLGMDEEILKYVSSANVACGWHAGDPLVMEEVLGEIRDIAKRGGISCACGSKKWTFRVNFSSVDLICQDCGAEMRIPAATADDIDDICCKTSLLIRGKDKT